MVLYLCVCVCVILQSLLSYEGGVPDSLFSYRMTAGEEPASPMRKPATCKRWKSLCFLLSPLPPRPAHLLRSISFHHVLYRRSLAEDVLGQKCQRHIIFSPSIILAVFFSTNYHGDNTYLAILLISKRVLLKFVNTINTRKNMTNRHMCIMLVSSGFILTRLL